MPLDDLTDLVDRWRGARGAMDRARVVTAGADVLRGLDGHERQALARGLAEQGAPDVAELVANRSGGAVSAGELNELTRALLTMEGDTFGTVVHDLQDPGERQRLLGDVAGRLAPPTGDPLPLPPPDAERPPPPPREAADDPGGTASAEIDEPPAVTTDAPDAAPDNDAPGAGASADDATPPEPAPRPATVGTPVPAVPRLAAPALRAPSPTPTPQPVARVRDAATARERLAAVGELATSPVEGSDLTTLLDAVPDGWQRRTTLRRLVEAGSVRDVDAGEVVTHFARPSDRVAAAARLVEAGHASLEEVSGALDSRATDRLRRRLER